MNQKNKNILSIMSGRKPEKPKVVAKQETPAEQPCFNIPIPYFDFPKIDFANIPPMNDKITDLPPIVFVCIDISGFGGIKIDPIEIPSEIKLDATNIPEKIEIQPPVILDPETWVPRPTLTRYSKEKLKREDAKFYARLEISNFPEEK